MRPFLVAKSVFLQSAFSFEDLVIFRVDFEPAVAVLLMCGSLDMLRRVTM